MDIAVSLGMIATDMSSSHHHALIPGAQVENFQILRVLGVGGFGITYLARDLDLEREIALK